MMIGATKVFPGLSGSISLFCLTVLFGAGAFTRFVLSQNGGVSGRPNVVVIVVDDLRTSLGCYGNPRMVTPNIDQLAKKSVRFERAFAQQALCGPSRASFLTSRRPDSTRVYDQHSYWRQMSGDLTTLPQHFKDQGYFTQSAGKVFHPGKASNFTDDYPASWSVPAYHPPTEQFKDAKVCEGEDGRLHMNVVCPVTVTQMPGGSLPDMQTSDFAVQFLRNRTRQPSQPSQPHQPFFLALGFHKPHIPLKFPKEYLDLYPMSDVHMATNPTSPLWMPVVAWNPWTDVRAREDVQALNVTFPFGPIPPSFQLKMRQSYYAATSYLDAQVGKVLSALDTYGFAHNTVIAFLSDHGWALGEHQEWAKYSNFDVATRVPLMFYVPGLTSRLSATGRNFPFKDALQGGRGSEVQALQAFSPQQPSEISSQLLSRMMPGNRRKRRQARRRNSGRIRGYARRNKLLVSSKLLVRDRRQTKGSFIRSDTFSRKQRQARGHSDMNSNELSGRKRRHAGKHDPLVSNELPGRKRRQTRRYNINLDSNELPGRRAPLGSPVPLLSNASPPEVGPAREGDRFVDGMGWRKIFQGNVLPFITRVNSVQRSSQRSVASLKYRLSLHIQRPSSMAKVHDMMASEFPQTTQALAELVDLFPTLAELAGLDVPPTCPPHSSSLDVTLCTEGSSLVPVIYNVSVTHDPARANAGFFKARNSRSFPTDLSHWKKAAFSQCPRPSFDPQADSDQPALKDIRIMGYTMRTDLYRYTEWIAFDPQLFRGNWSHVHAKELYVHGTDPGEDKNVAYFPQYSDLLHTLSEQLRQGWRSALPG